MVYSSVLKKGIGALRSSLEQAGLGSQDPCFHEHGVHEPLADAPLVLVACSGGRDSLALAALAALVCPTLGLKCGTVIIDHGLLAESGQVANTTAATCSQLGLAPNVIEQVTISPTKSGLESDARDARYEALIRNAKNLGAQAVLLAHTADDQAEGLMIGLIRSAGLSAVAGMKAHIERDGIQFLRPLLQLSRAETTQICQHFRLQWWDDPTNGDDFDSRQPLPITYPLRSRIRHDLLPFFSEFACKDMGAQLSKTAQLTSEVFDYMNQEASRLLERSRIAPTEAQIEEGVLACVRANTLQEAHPALCSQMWVCLCNELEISVGSKQVEELNALIYSWHGQAPLGLSKYFSAVRKRHVILICKNREHAHR